MFLQRGHLASCSFTSNSSKESDKDQLLLQLVSYILDEGHYVEKDLDDNFSSKAFHTYIDMIDPYKSDRIALLNNINDCICFEIIVF